MKQIPFSIKNRQELHDCIEKVQQEARALKNLSCVLVSIFMDTANERMLQEMKHTINASFPEAQIVGSVSRGEIVNGTLVEHDIVVNFTLFECSKVRVMSYDFRMMSSEQAGKELLAILNADKEVAAVEVISAGFHLDVNPFFHEVSKSRQEIVFFGGLADDGSLGQNGMVFAQNTTLRHGVAVAVFSGSKLHVQASSSFGWKPLGRSMTVTKMDGEFCLKELDGMPALDVFERYLGIVNNDRFLVESLTFPFYFERNGTVLARHPRRCREDGGVMFGADFRVGERVRLAYGDPSDIIENAMVLQEKLANFRPEAIFMVSCVARWMLLGSDTEQELSVTRHLAPSSGFYAYGEFMRNDAGEIMVSNMTLVTIGMREGPGRSEKREIKVEHPKFKPHRTIMAHLVHLIETTTQELEETNAKLAKLAQLDRLTEVFNRGETEMRLATMLQQSQLSGQPLAVLMLDIDDFKGINDSFGHEMGDKVIEAVAGILREVTRTEVDAPGRWGGDEFLVVFPDMAAKEGHEIAERIRKEVAALDFLPEGRRVTVSIGLATAAEDDTTNALCRRVDMALYEAKRSGGKNMVIMH
ncbi:diguanylate cyclase (GGDEF) domain-containing protein [Selenomonas ruminantium]|uniref:Diguanylate cyclase (GGDEF) domain-containing protein n=1 Tax=Selenomonas ruminantium TaxID=971 RepID=A0A1I3I262_SELRU|nr:diguanylate cyclase [Selenomonas ruminantium]SFI42098.1 diguanylate cyclase (GGDEF) domain-containing protein [Selenomonas ruminantium]